MATVPATPFYLDMGFTKTQIGLVAKNAGLWPMIIGGILGGVLRIKIGINKVLWLFGGVQLVTITGFAVLAEMGISIIALAVVISLEYLGAGLGTAAFVAFIARSTHPKYAATQIALFTALPHYQERLPMPQQGILLKPWAGPIFLFFGWYWSFQVCCCSSKLQRGIVKEVA